MCGQKKDSDSPSVDGRVSLGDICAFKLDSKDSNCDTWRIGRITQFSNYKEKLKKDRQYKEDFAEINSAVGVLCSWYHSISTNSQSFQHEPQTNPGYVSLKSSLFVHYFMVALLK